MIEALAIYRRLSPLIALAIIPLAILLGVAKIDARHWHKQSDRYEQLYHDEQAALLKTQLNYIDAAERARQADAANKARVEAEQKAVNERTAHDYEARIAAARADAERLRRAGQTPAHPGSPRTAPVSGVPGTTAGAGPTTPKAGLPEPDALVATEQAIQLDELIRWVNRQVAIDVNGGK